MKIRIADNLPMITATLNDGGVSLRFHVDALTVGELHVANFVIQAGNTDYGYEFDAILGFDFLLEVGAIVDFDRMEMRRKASQP